MPDQAVEIGFKIWAADDVVYGPVNIPTLADWVRDERVLAETWVFCVGSGRWVVAGDIPELRPLLYADDPAQAHAQAQGGDNVNPALKPTILRRVRALAELADGQLNVFSPPPDQKQ